MTSLTEQHLLKLAQEDEEHGDIQGAINNLEEALNNYASNEIIVKLCQLYRRNKQEDQAYTLIKEVPDLFSEPQVFEEYQKILQANNYLIEALELKKVAKIDLTEKIKPAELQIQQQIMTDFRKNNEVSQFDYQKLFKLDLVNFKNFAQSLLLDPSQNFAVRLSLCEDLIKLGVKDQIKIWVIGDQTDFVPSDTVLLEKSTVYKEVISGIGDRFRKNPSQLPLMLGEVNLILGSLYPKLNQYIKDTDSFTSSLVSYLENRKGGIYQDLLNKIYNNLPK